MGAQFRQQRHESKPLLPKGRLIRVNPRHPWFNFSAKVFRQALAQIAFGAPTPYHFLTAHFPQ